jgi:glutathione S-transferase
MKLISASTSPFARKVRVVLAEKNVEYRLVEQSPWDAGYPMHAYSPLGKVPVLMLDDGTALYDSRVIVEYLDDLAPMPRLIPESSGQRLAVKRWEALADGVSDAIFSIAIERRRPASLQSEDWVERQRRKIADGIAALARELDQKPWCNGDAYSLADVATGCALVYLDLRQPDLGWREQFSNLARLAEKLGERPAFQAAA